MTMVSIVAAHAPVTLLPFHASPFHLKQNHQRQLSSSCLMPSKRRTNLSLSCSISYSKRTNSSSSERNRLPSQKSSNYDSFSASQNPLDHLSKFVSFLATNNILKNVGTVSGGLVLLYHGISLVNSIITRKRSSGGSGGGKGGGGRGGGGGEGGGKDDNFLSRILNPKAMADDDDDEEEEESQSKEWDSHGLPANIVIELKKLSESKRYKVSNIVLYDEVQRSTLSIAGQRPLMDIISLKPGGIYTKEELQKELETLSSHAAFEKLALQGITQPDGTIGIKISFKETEWESPRSFRCMDARLMREKEQIEMDADYKTDDYLRRKNNQLRERIEESAIRPCLFPMEAQQEVSQMLSERRKVTWSMLQKISNRVEQWYHKNGYTAVRLGNFNFTSSNELVLEVTEGEITQLKIQFLDKLGNVCQGNTKLAVVMRELPKQVQPGQVFNIEAARHALRNIKSLPLFSSVQLKVMKSSLTGNTIVNMNLKETEQKSAEVNMEWNIVPGRGNPLMLATLQPSGTISFEHRNMRGLNRSISGSFATSNLFDPNDLGFQLEYVHPYVDGIQNPRNRTFRASCFNDRKESSIFASGLGANVEVPHILVDRSGIKANITEDFTRQSKFTYGVAMVEITTRDKNCIISPRGPRALANDEIGADGPPTTFSGTGIDHMAMLQANITRDDTKFVNGAIVGQRNIFQVDQGLGIGRNFPFFNRHKLTLTRFIQLKKVEQGSGKPRPPVLVLHGRYGGCIGDLPVYEAFAIGGPHSVRGYNRGEIGAARNMLELAAEIRMPVRNTQAYVFVEHGNDLGTSKDVNGNPTKVSRRVGHGSSYGVGVYLGSVRLEYAIGDNFGFGAIHVQAGERF